MPTPYRSRGQSDNSDRLANMSRALATISHTHVHTGYTWFPLTSFPVNRSCFSPFVIILEDTNPLEIEKNTQIKDLQIRIAKYEHVYDIQMKKKDFMTIQRPFLIP